MLEVRMDQDSLLKKVLESVKDVFGDANFEFSSSGLIVQAKDRRNIAVVILRLESNGFAYYNCDTIMSMGMNLKNLATMLNSARDDDTVTLNADEGMETVTFIFEGPTRDKVELEMTLIGTQDLAIPEACKGFNSDIDGDQLAVDGPPLSLDSQGDDDLRLFYHMTLQYHDAIVTMPSSELSRICELLSGIGDRVVISVTKDELRLSTKGGYIGAANIICSHNTTPENSTIIKMRKPEPVSMTLDLPYLTSFTKPTALSQTVTIRFTSELPVVIEYNKIDEMKGFIRFYLSPQIEEHDEEEHDEELSTILLIEEDDENCWDF